MRMALPEAGPEIRMVESLQSMWDEEKQRIGCSPPPPPPEPLRTPTPLCLHVEAVRAQFQVFCSFYCSIILFVVALLGSNSLHGKHGQLVHLGVIAVANAPYACLHNRDCFVELPLLCAWLSLLTFIQLLYAMLCCYLVSQAIVDEHKQEEEEGKAQDAIPAPQTLPLTPLTAAANSLPHTASSKDVPPTPARISTPSIAAASNTHTPAAATSAAGAVAATVSPAVAATPAATPALASLLKYTQPANLLTSSPLAATPASRQQGAGESPAHAAGVALQARPLVAGMHAPSQATQNTEVK